MASRLDLGFPAVKPGQVNQEMLAAQEEGDETWGFDLIVDCTGMIFYKIHFYFFGFLFVF